MTRTIDFEQFCTALENAESQDLHLHLLRDPSLAVAVLPDGWPVFLLQSVNPRPEIIDLLIEYGAAPNARNASGGTLLHLTGDPEAIRKLASLGADINAKDHQGRTPMMGHAPYPETGVDAIYALLAAGADPNVEAHNGETLATLIAAEPRYDQLRRALRRNA